MSSVTVTPPTAQHPAKQAGGLLYVPIRHPLLSITVAAVMLRLVVFLGRGDYIAFDEGWYLLLGRSLMHGAGYSLTGLVHTTLSPLFPALAGVSGAILDDAVWGGRVVAAIAAGLLVWPCWSIARRLFGDDVARTTAVLVATMPTLGAFAAPYWMRWDLWVGAEPLLHLFLFGALALLLRARDSGRSLDWAAAGACFAFAFLARSEAIIVFAIAGAIAGIAALRSRSPARIVRTLACAAAFLALATPYWIYLHDALDRWTVTGRAVELPVPRRGDAPRSGAGAAVTIEGMLWGDDERPYVRTLYGLNESATALSSTYWGVPVRTVDSRPPVTESSRTSAGHEDAPGAEPTAVDARATAPPSRVMLYLRALLVVVPWYVWPFVGLGLFGRRRDPHGELLVAVPVVLTSVAIARIVAADPRTQLFIVPLVLLFAARGIHRLGDGADGALAPDRLRPGFARRAVFAIVVAVFFATSLRWVYMGATLGSPHHLVGAANREVGSALQRRVPPDEPVMSWHPAIAIYADRDWRVLPLASLPEIVRYANAIGSEYIVLSPYYPGPRLLEDESDRHVLLRVPAGTGPVTDGWQLRLEETGGAFVLATLHPDPTGTGGEDRE